MARSCRPGGEARKATTPIQVSAVLPIACSSFSAISGVTLRIVDQTTHEPLPAGSVGLLEACVTRTGGGWIRTTDLALLDTEGFLFLVGRADAAINRGGFKVIPDQVAAILRAHPSVADAAVVGIPNLRLGEVPEISPQTITRARMCMMLEMTAILGILLCAPFMARGIGSH